MYVTCPTRTAPSIDTLNGGGNIYITWSQVCCLLFRDAAIFYMQQPGLEWNDNCVQERATVFIFWDFNCSVGRRWLNMYGALLEWYLQGKTEVFVDMHVLLSCCLPQIPPKLVRDRTLPSAVRGRRITAWTMARLDCIYSFFNSRGIDTIEVK